MVQLLQSLGGGGDHSLPRANGDTYVRGEYRSVGGGKPGDTEAKTPAGRQADLGSTENS